MHYADYSVVYRKVNEVLYKLNISSIPISLENIIDKVPGLELCPYSDVIKKRGCTFNEWIAFLGSDLGAYTSDEKRNRYIIFYNDTKHNVGLDRFTIAHELGHHFLNHSKYLKYGDTLLRGLSKPEYAEIEKEANCFARNLLCPIPLIEHIGIRNDDIESIKTLFNLSNKAANIRVSCYDWDKQKCTEKITSFYFYRFKKEIDFHRAEKQCLNCKHVFKIIDSNFCPICGNGSDYLVTRGVKQYMKYDGIKVDEFGKATECPVCKNEEIGKDGDHCRICGTMLVNRCSMMAYGEYGENPEPAPCQMSIDHPLPGNARFCPYCGSQTTFYANSLLKEWYYKPSDSQKSSLDSEEKDDLPF